jgi:hypothetical protein
MDLPFEDACSPTVIQFALDANGEIDTDATTSLEDTLMRARSSRAPDPASILKKPWSELIADAKPIEPEAKPIEPPALPPAPPSGPVAQAPVAVVPAPQPPPPPVAPVPPLVTKPPPPPVIIPPKTVDIRSIPYGEIDPANGAKNMSESQRGVGMVLVGVGSVVQIITMRLGIGTAIGAVFFDLTRDPVIIALVATGIVAAIGLFTRKKGTKVLTDGMKNATQVLK